MEPLLAGLGTMVANRVSETVCRHKRATRKRASKRMRALFHPVGARASSIQSRSGMVWPWQWGCLATSHYHLRTMLSNIFILACQNAASFLSCTQDAPTGREPVVHTFV